MSTEADIQKSIVDYFKIAAPKYGFLYFSVPLEGVAKNMMNKFKAMGMIPGTSDLVIVHNGRALFLEIKKPSGRLQENQKDFRQWVFDCGAEYCVVHSIDEVFRALDVWGIR